VNPSFWCGPESNVAKNIKRTEFQGAWTTVFQDSLRRPLENTLNFLEKGSVSGSQF